jgi:AraC-like DNA-binding protein
MNRALSLLAQGTLSVGEISDACGFSDEKYFSRAFKKVYGYPPSHFKSNV